MNTDSNEPLTPVTVGDLRKLLSDPGVPDYLPVIVGGVDFDTPTRRMIGVADDLWLDGEGMVGGRVVIAAKGAGLVDGA